MYAFFNNIAERGVDRENVQRNNVVNTKPFIRLPAPELEAKLAEFDRQIAVLEKEIKRLTDALKPQQTAWEQERLNHPPAWNGLQSLSVRSESGRPQFTVSGEGAILTEGEIAETDTYVVSGQVALNTIRGVQLEVFTIPGTTNRLGLSQEGTFVLNTLDLEIRHGQGTRQVTFQKVNASSERPGFKANLLLRPRENGIGGWSGLSKTGEVATAVFETAAPVNIPDGATLIFKLNQNNPGKTQIGHFRLSLTDDSHPLPLSAPLKKIFGTPLQKRNAKDAKTALDYFLSYQPDYRKASDEMARLQRERKETDDLIPRTMVMEELPEPRKAFILIRGAYDQPGEEVFPAVPAILPQLPPGAPVNRLGLAHWLVSPENPLTARVTMNRYWAAYFGRGLVKTVEDFGIQGDPPSHPELLDWLATEFIRSGWDIKAMQKLIAMSATYRQASHVSPDLLERDPANILLARGPRLRLPAEMIRDQALAASGLLAGKIGGPSVKPYQPAGLWEELAAGAEGTGFATYKQGTGEDLYRRSLYTFWKRTVSPPTMSTFDAPSREFCTVSRSRTSTPLQALALLNDVTYVEASRKLAERMLTEGGVSMEQRIRYGFQLVTAREPKRAELRVLKAGLVERMAGFRKNPESAAELISVGESSVRKDLPVADLAAYTTVASVILNLDEAITKQ